jgi:hypothetical protein
VGLRGRSKSFSREHTTDAALAVLLAAGLWVVFMLDRSRPDEATLLVVPPVNSGELVRPLRLAYVWGELAQTDARRARKSLVFQVSRARQASAGPKSVVTI